MRPRMSDSMSDPSPDRFVQSRLHWRVACELVEDGLIYERRSLLTQLATRVPFESMPDDPVRETRISRFWSAAVVASFAAFLFFAHPFVEAGADAPLAPVVVAALSLGVSVLGLRARSGHFIVFPCEGKRVVFKADGGVPSLDAFLDRLQIKKSKYLSETYGPRPTEPEGERMGFGPSDEAEDDPGGYRH
jgi:hypothetical protein